MKKNKPNHKKRVVISIVLILAIIFLLTISIIVIEITRNGQEELQIGESTTVALETSNKENLNKGTLPVPKIEVLTEHSACSTDEEPWYNNESVEVKIEKTKDIDNEKCRVMYAIRKKENNTNTEKEANIEEYKELTENSENISITEEGKTEIIAYTVNREGEKSEEVRQLVQIDRTAPTVGGIDYSEEDGEVLMVTQGAEDNNNGSGIAEYMYFKDNNIQPTDIISYNKVDTCERPEVAKISISRGECLAQVAVTDRAGNVATQSRAVSASGGRYMFTYSTSPASAYFSTNQYNYNSDGTTVTLSCYLIADSYATCRGYYRLHWRGATNNDARCYVYRRGPKEQGLRGSESVLAGPSPTC